MNNFKIWRTGMKDGLPICLGYFAVAFTFGIKAADVGLSPFQAFLLSVTNLTSAGQFAGLDLIAYGAAFTEMAFTQFILNLRYCLMSCALSQKLEKGTNPIHRFFIAFGITDEIFGVSICRKEDLKPLYYYGVMSLAIPAWSFGTLLGVILGDIMPAVILSSLGIAIYGMFLAVIIPVAKSDKIVLSIIVSAMLLSTGFHLLPFFKDISTGFRIIIITVVVSGIAAIVFPIKEEVQDE